MATFYGHFVAGPDQVAIQPRIQHLREHGVKAILDYSVEEDITDEEAKKSESMWVYPVSHFITSTDFYVVMPFSFP